MIIAWPSWVMWLFVIWLVLNIADKLLTLISLWRSRHGIVARSLSCHTNTIHCYIQVHTKLNF